MRTETKLFVGLGVFMLPLGIVYWFTSHERAGSLLLLIVAVAFLFIGCYLGIQASRMDGARPEDHDATPEEGAGVVGAFPVGSIWPFVAALGVMIGAYGAVFSALIAVPGLALIFASTIGMARESELSELHHEDLDAHSSPGVNPNPTFSDQVKR